MYKGMKPKKSKGTSVIKSAGHGKGGYKHAYGARPHGFSKSKAGMC